MRYHFSLVKIVIKTKDKCWSGCGKKRTFIHYWWESNLLKSLENGMEFPQQTKLLYETATSLSLF